VKHLKSFHKLDESYLKIHPELELFLISTYQYNSISRMLLRLKSDPDAVKSINFLSPSPESDTIYFSNDNKFLDVDVKDFSWSSQQKDTIKIGRAVRKIFSDKDISCTDRELDEFVNLYKAHFIDKSKIHYDIVTGEKIRYWYLDTNYNKLAVYSSLGKSCMAYLGTQPFLDLYVENPEVCSMAIMVDTENKLLARALIWKDIDGVYQIDRIYNTEHWNNASLSEWIENWMHQQNKSFTHLDRTRNITVKLTKWKFKHYPYLDSMRYLNYNKGLLFSNERVSKDSNSEKSPVISLHSTSGEYSCPHEWVWYKTEDILIKRKMARWSKEIGSYVPLRGFRKVGRYISNMFENNSYDETEMDDILDRINQNGIDSLSPTEKKKLGIIEDLTPKESIIEEIKHIIENIGTVTSQELEMDASPLFKESRTEIHLVERFNQNDATVIVYGGRKYENEIDDYEISYDLLDEDTLEDILERLKEHEEYISWKNEGFPFDH